MKLARRAQFVAQTHVVNIADRPVRLHDTMSAGNNSQTDMYIIRDGDGNDTITDFDPGEPDIISFDMVEINSFQDVQDRLSYDGTNTIITYDNGSTTTLNNVHPNDLTSTNFQYQSSPVCLLAGSQITTANGSISIEDLCVGDLVLTLDNGLRPIVEILRQDIDFDAFNACHKPILMPRNALGKNTPNAALITSPQHRVLFACPETNIQILVAAVKLTKRKGVRRKRGAKNAVYYNLLLEGHQIIYANGCAVETLLVTPFTKARLKSASCLASKLTKAARPITGVDPLFDAVADKTPMELSV
jgi:hypothetical protein